jgi:hypothetical protein
MCRTLWEGRGEGEAYLAHEARDHPVHTEDKQRSVYGAGMREFLSSPINHTDTVLSRSGAANIIAYSGGSAGRTMVITTCAEQ